MAIDENIHWYEGLFLQPHHLQAMQTRLGHDIERGRLQAGPYRYGVINAKLSTDELDNFLVRFEQLHVIMPSGLEIAFPDNASLPSLNIKEAFDGKRNELTVYLAVPVFSANQSNSIEGEDADWRIKRRYRVIERELMDENLGDHPEPVKTRQINARLVLSSEDHSDLELLPLIKITTVGGDESGKPRLENDFAPPCFQLQGSESLWALVWDLANQVVSTRADLVVQLNRGGYSVDALRGMQLEQLLRLRTLNVHAARLTSLCEAHMISPFVYYLQLRDLLGELAALQPDRDVYDAPAYDHDDPKPVFVELSKRIRSLIRGMVTGGFLRVAFESQNTMQVAVLKDEHLHDLKTWYLGVRTREDQRDVVKLLEDGDQFKLTTKSMAQTRVRGLVIKEERFPPVELPADPHTFYFRFIPEDSQRMWERLKDERELSAIWPGIEQSDYQLALYVTVPATGDDA